MKEKTQIKVILSIFGDEFLPENLTQLLNISPSKSWIKGDKVHDRNNLYRKESSWDYEIGFVQTLFLDEVYNMLLTVFENNINALKNYITENNLEVKIYIVIEIYDEEKPSIYFERRFLIFLNELNAEVDMDMYMLKNYEE